MKLVYKRRELNQIHSSFNDHFSDHIFDKTVDCGSVLQKEGLLEIQKSNKFITTNQKQKDILQVCIDGYFPKCGKANFGPAYDKNEESRNTDMLLRDLLLITHHYIQSNSKTS